MDTGASASVISEATYQQLWPETPPVLHPSAIKLRTYTGEALKILGSTTVAVKYQGQTAKLPLLIIKGAGPSLLGKDWLSSIRLPWQHLLHKIQTDSTDLQHLLKKHASVFKAELGSAKGFTAKIHVEEKAKPLFCKARPVTYALEEKSILRLTVSLERESLNLWSSLIGPPDRTCSQNRWLGSSVWRL